MTTHSKPPAADPKPVSRGNWLAFAVICAGQFIYLMDIFLLNVSAPQILREYQNPAVLKGVFAVNQIAFASFVFFGGRLGDLFGRRRVFVIGLAGAGLAALFAAFAENAIALIIARALQGMFGALFIPQIMALLIGMFDGEARAKAVGIFGMVIGFGGVAGFLSGGLLVEFASTDIGWRSVFFFIGPALLLLAGASLILVPATPKASQRALHLSASLVLFVAALLIIGPVASIGLLPPMQLALIGGLGVLIAVALLLQQRQQMRRTGGALISSTLASTNVFKVGVQTVFLFFLANTSFYLTTTLYLSAGFDLSPFELAISYLPMGLVFIIGAKLGANRVRRVGARAVRQGLLLQVLSLFGFAACLALASPSWMLSIALLVPFGFAQGLSMAPLMALTVSGAQPEETGPASGGQQASQQFGNAAGIAILTSLFVGVQAGTDVSIAMQVTLVCLGLISLCAWVSAKRF